MTGPIRQHPDERREQAETDMLTVYPPTICESPAIPDAREPAHDRRWLLEKAGE